MNKEKLWNRYPVLCGGIFFGAASLVINVMTLIWLGMAHVYDVVHIFPVVFLLAVLPEEPNVQWPLAVIALVVDVLVGFLMGAILKKTKCKDGTYVSILVLSMLIFQIAICFQWIPII